MSVRNAEFQIISALRTNRTKRSKEKEVFVEGTESIKQLLAARWEITRILFRETVPLSHWAKDVISKHPKVKLYSVTEEMYLELSEKDTPSELIVTAKIKQALSLSLLSTSLAPGSQKNPFFVLFDRPSDLGNFGSLLRSADAFQVDAILVLGHAIDVYDPKVIRSSLGSLFHTKLVFVDDFSSLVSFVEAEKTRVGLRVVGSDSTGERNLKTTEIQTPILLVLGNEKKGMSVQLQSLCDEIISIPMLGVVNSLNVACAGSILLWEVAKRRYR